MHGEGGGDALLTPPVVGSLAGCEGKDESAGPGPEEQRAAQTGPSAWLSRRRVGGSGEARKARASPTWPSRVLAQPAQALRSAIPSGGSDAAPWPRSALTGRQHGRRARVFGPCLRGDRPSCLRRRCPLPGQRRALGSKSTGASAHDVPTAHATSTGPRDPQTPGPARVPPRAPGKGAPSAHDPLPSPGRAWAGPHWPVLVIIQGWPEAPSVELLYPRWSA